MIQSFKGQEEAKGQESKPVSKSYCSSLDYVGASEIIIEIIKGILNWDILEVEITNTALESCIAVGVDSIEVVCGIDVLLGKPGSE